MGHVKAVNFSTPDTIESLLPDWQIHLESRGRAPRAIATYLFAVGRFTAWLTEQGLSHEVGAIRRDDIEAWTAASMKTLKPATVSLRWRALAVFFKWVEEVEIVPVSPMSKLHPPRVPDKIVPQLPSGAVAKLLKTVSGKSFRDRRDLALLTLLADTGIRLGELTDLRFTPNNPETHDVDLAEGHLRVMGKGQRERRVPLGRITKAALSRYILIRRTHPAARLPWLWLSGSNHSRLTDSGIRQMLSDRADQAHLPHIHPHMLRHNFAHAAKLADMRDEDIMSIAGWRSRSMLSRYGNSAAASRAQAAHLRHSLVDNL
jgi:site-specific recombinase XerD